MGLVLVLLGVMLDRELLRRRLLRDWRLRSGRAKSDGGYDGGTGGWEDMSLS